MNNFKKLLTVFSLCIIINACSTNETLKQTESLIKVEYSETYELANIILALTEYGKSDPTEVRKDFKYYNEVMEYFEPVCNHRLLDSVNYSRKRWNEYLSFRTDAYAFYFDDDNKLKRKFDFFVIDSITAFDNHLSLINDFVEKSNFRNFFSAHKGYYASIKKSYQEKLYLNEMKEFLTEQFGIQEATDYRVIFSPLVNRMNCHREIDSTTLDFITLPDFLVSPKDSVMLRDLAIGIHYIFTEMNHGFVNPTTQKYDTLVLENFNENIWSEKSGYENSQNAVFNEYMTWAIYDIFIQKYFPKQAKEVGLYWSYQNDTRGFIYPEKFTQKLIELYSQKANKTSIADLYPKFLKWIDKEQAELTKPRIINTQKSISSTFEKNIPIEIEFSESMQKLAQFTVSLQDAKEKRTTLKITSQHNDIQWSEDGKTLRFSINIPSENDKVYVIFNWWDSPVALFSEKGVLLKSMSYIKLINH